MAAPSGIEYKNTSYLCGGELATHLHPMWELLVSDSAQLVPQQGDSLNTDNSFQFNY
jgi:hypothetical protein